MVVDPLPEASIWVSLKFLILGVCDDTDPKRDPLGTRTPRSLRDHARVTRRLRSPGLGMLLTTQDFKPQALNLQL